MPSRIDSAAIIVDVCHRLHARGFVTATDGNVSMRLPEGTILMTRSGVSKGSVEEEDLVEIGADGKKLRGRGEPSTESGMHLFIYRERPDVHAVVHAHPPYATGCAAARISLNSPVFPEVIVGFGTIPLAAYATPSTHEVADSLAPYVGSHEAILLANHGAVTYAATGEEAFQKMEKVEHIAQMTFIARVMGGAVPLTGEELERLAKASLNNYGKPIRNVNS